MCFVPTVMLFSRKRHIQSIRIGLRVTHALHLKPRVAAMFSFGWQEYKAYRLREAMQ